MKKYDMSRIELAKVKLPTMGEYFNRSPWVSYGENNDYPNYLINQYNSCAIHKSIVNAKRELICGDGIKCKEHPLIVVSPVNGKELIDDVFRKCALDFVLFGGFALNIILSKDRKTISELYHLDFSKVRSGKISDDDEVEEYFYSTDWSNTRKHVPKRYPSFDMNNSEPSQILYHFEYTPNSSFYPVPDYSGGLASINIDIQIKDFHNNNLKNGFNPSLFINFNNGIPSEDEKQVITQALKEQYSGSGNAGEPVISFNESKELSPEIVQIGTNASDNYYSSLYEHITRNILSSHRVSSAELFGIATPGKLGGADEIIQHSEFFRTTVIIPYIQEMLPVFNKIMKFKTELPIRLEIKPLTILSLDDKTTENID